MADSIQIQILDGLYKALKKQIDYYSRDDLNLSNVPKDERVAILAELGTIHTRLSAFANSDMLLTLNDIETIKKDYEALISNIPSGSTYDDTFVLDSIDSLKKSLSALKNALLALEQQLGVEFYAFDLKSASEALEEIIGKISSDDLLDQIFDQFCIGK